MMARARNLIVSYVIIESVIIDPEVLYKYACNFCLYILISHVNLFKNIEFAKISILVPCTRRCEAGNSLNYRKLLVDVFLRP